MKSKEKSNRPKGPGRSLKELAQDDQVMATNNSSIVSKRSVERIYYPDEPHFFRYFVKKFQRRAPLINRGYHLRLHVIDVLIREFLKKDAPAQKTKVLINLGCGSDVLPWQCLTRYPEDCRGAKFIDVDFPDLIRRKRQTVLTTPELKDPLISLDETDKGSVVLQSEQYVQIGCDLRQLQVLEKAISSIVDISQCSFFFVAEVSITYMETDGADEVIKWASSLGDAQFCLLEQILPDGPGHPFAKTMLGHFDKLNTPPKSVQVYQTLEAQRQRFSSRGWTTANVWTLWQAWADSKFLSSEERQKLDAVEPFDEWEEFAIFGSHYCLVHALTGLSELVGGAPKQVDDIELPVQKIEMKTPPNQDKKVQRRFGASMYLAENGCNSFCNFLGLGSSGRLESYDLFGPTNIVPELRQVQDFTEGPPSRMCHAMTPNGLLCGGRTSPMSPLKDSWLLSPAGCRRLKDLPRPLYRHSVTTLDYSDHPEAVKPKFLLIGGKDGPSSAFDGAYALFDWHLEWKRCKVVGEELVPVSGAFLTSIPTPEGDDFRGIYGGGIEENGLISEQLLAWHLRYTGIDDEPILTFSKLDFSTCLENNEALCHLFKRYGAFCVAQPSLSHPSKQPNDNGCVSLVLLGGIAQHRILAGRDELLLFNVTHKEDGGCQITRACRLVDEEVLSDGNVRPLLIGASIGGAPDGQLTIMGGGATCFSMGSYWNTVPFSFHVDPKRILEMKEGTKAQDPKFSSSPIELWKTQGMPVAVNPKHYHPLASRSRPLMAQPRTGRAQHNLIPKVILNSAEEFQKILRDRKPVVLSKVNVGPCTSSWNLDYLKAKVGGAHQVVIHDSSTRNMDFVRKNFQYVTTSFENFVSRIEKGDMLYLRALSSEEPSGKPTDLAQDFPSLAQDFKLPPELVSVSNNIFSSVLRVSGPVNMWLHYDVMANVYCQISGSKRMLLFPPSDVQHLSFRPGASSSNLDIFDSSDATIEALNKTNRYEAVVEPGDVLFIPPLWLHAGNPESDASIAVNVFFRDLEDRSGYAPGRDVYGNRDLAAYEKGRQDVAKIAKAFEKLPVDTREFYLLRLAEELKGSVTG